MRFVDTNVLLYAVSELPLEADKRRTALELLNNRTDLAISVQVLQEFYHQSTHPNRPEAITQEEAMKFIGDLGEIPVQDMTHDIFHQGVEISQRYRISYWDGAILAAARALGCDAVYTEDLSEHQEYDGIRIINPFREEQPSS